jgi:hypothetical protein
LQPGYAMAVLVVLRAMVEAALGRYSVPKEIFPQILALAVFVLVSIISLWVAVLVFQGKVLVVGGTDYFELTAAAPWTFRRENITQLVYLMLGGCLVWRWGSRFVACRQMNSRAL